MKKETVNNLPIIFGAISIILLPIMFLSAILAILAIFLGFKNKKPQNKKSRLTGIILGILVMIMIIVYTIIHIALGFSPVVLINSCSMYHNSDFENWWEENKGGYESNNITKYEFENSPMKNGLSRGDIVLLKKETEYKIGDIIIFSNSALKDPLINRIISTNPYQTKGDNNARQLTKENNQAGIDETNITAEEITGKVTFKIPYFGRTKIIISELLTNKQNGFCK